MKTFTRFICRQKRSLTGFNATDPAEQPALLHAICTNPHTGYVRQLTAAGPVNVPNHAADAVESYLLTVGWSRGRQ